jgi:D-xylose transport system substrate-binding protein
MKRIGILTLTSLLLIGIFAGCSKKAETAAGDKTIFVGALYDSLQVESRVRQRDYLEVYSKERGIDLVFQDAGLSEKVQMEQAENLITQGVDAIVVLAHNAEAIKPLGQMCKDAGVLLICTDRLIEGAPFDYFVGFDNDQVGYAQVGYALERYPRGNYILVAGAPTDPNVILWQSVWDAELKPYVDRGDIRIILEERSDNWDTNIAATYTENGLTMANNDVQVVLAMNDGLATGVVQVLQQNGLAGKVLVTGLDGEQTAYQRIAEGTQTMTMQVPDEDVVIAMLDVIKTHFTEGEAAAKAMLPDTINNGYADIPALLLPYETMDKSTLGEAIRKGYVTYEAAYANVPKADRPPRP